MAATTSDITVKVQFGKACFTHCCPRHGCKYGYGEWNDAKTCPIATGYASPRYPENNHCEQCAPELEAIKAAKKVARDWNTCDPESSIPAEAAAQMAIAAIAAYIRDDLV